MNDSPAQPAACMTLRDGTSDLHPHIPMSSKWQHGMCEASPSLRLLTCCQIGEFTSMPLPFRRSAPLPKAN